MEPNNQIVFGIADDTTGGEPLIILGISEAAWQHMKDGKTHHFDFYKAGLPVKLVLFGAPTREKAVQMLNGVNKAQNFKDRTAEDFGIKGAKKG